MIPKVRGVLKWRELLTELEDYDKVIIPYENTRGMMGTKEVFQQLHHAKRLQLLSDLKEVLILKKSSNCYLMMEN